MLKIINNLFEFYGLIKLYNRNWQPLNLIYYLSWYRKKNYGDEYLKNWQIIRFYFHEICYLVCNKLRILSISSNAKQETQTSNTDENLSVKVEKPFLNTKKQDTPVKLPDIPSPPPSKEIFLTQPEEDQKQTSVMAASMAAQR